MTKLMLTAGAALAAALAAVPAAAADPAGPPAAITISGSAAVVTDYRFRGVSQSDKELAVQAGITISHKSGFYVAVWGSNLSGWGTFGGANLETDVIGGFKHTFGTATVDVGLLWYMYPGGYDNTDFAEPYAKLSGVAGPVTLTASVAYAPKQYALANVSNAPNSRNQKQDNLYLAGDAAAAIPSTPFTLKAHIGHSWGNKGLGPNGTSVSPTGRYWDWSLGVDTTYKMLTLGLAYVDTDLSFNSARVQRLQPNFSKGQDGTGSIANGALVVSLTAAF